MAGKPGSKGEQLTLLPVPSIEGEGLGWQARMTALHDDYGFVPTTVEERNVAFGAIPFEGAPGKTGAHFNEILIHQSKNPAVEAPDRTVRAIVRAMDTFRVDALGRRASLLEMHGVLQDANPRLDVREVDDLPMLGRLSVVQHHRILEGIKSGDPRPLAGGIKTVDGKKRLVTAFDAETHDETSTQMLIETLPVSTVLAVRGLVMASGKSHRGRAEFWHRMLDDSRNHAAARPLIKQILG